MEVGDVGGRIMVMGVFMKVGGGGTGVETYGCG